MSSEASGPERVVTDMRLHAVWASPEPIALTQEMAVFEGAVTPETTTLPMTPPVIKTTITRAAIPTRRRVRRLRVAGALAPRSA